MLKNQKEQALKFYISLRLEIHVETHPSFDLWPTKKFTDRILWTWQRFQANKLFDVFLDDPGKEGLFKRLTPLLWWFAQKANYEETLLALTSGSVVCWMMTEAWKRLRWQDNKGKRLEMTEACRRWQGPAMFIRVFSDIRNISKGIKHKRTWSL